MGKKLSLKQWQTIVDDADINVDLLSIKHHGRHRHFICKCRVCNQTFERDACKSDLLRACWYCTGKAAIHGKTDIATTAPWMVKYFKNKNIALQYKHGSNYRTIFKCPECGHEKDLCIKDVYTYGYKCSVCSDSFTKPNKFLRALFAQLPINNVIYEYHSEWTKNRYYDAYFEYNANKYIIEMDGDQHRLNTTWSTLEKQQRIDQEKDELALSNDIHLIRIKAQIYRYEYWIEQFKESEISELLSSVDWQKCIENTETNQTRLIADYFNTHTNATLKDISEEFGICRSTTAEYLRIATQLGWCNYSHEESKKRSDKFNASRTGCRNRLKDNKGNIIGEYETLKECAEKLSILCNRKINRDTIRAHFKRGKEIATFGSYYVEKVS